MKRRDFINLGGIGLLAACTPVPKTTSGSTHNDSTTAKFAQTSGHIFPALPYSYNALEPHIDALTMEIHYSKHHKGYFNKFTDFIDGTELETTSMPAIFAQASQLSSNIINNAGGYYNHSLFWENLSPDKTEASGKLLSAIVKHFHSIDDFKASFYKAAKTHFGSGWAWLILDENKKLVITTSSNQDNPLMDNAQVKGIPLLTIDIWEHAYYLKYKNMRGDFINSFWNIVNWKVVSKRYEKALKGEWIG